MPPDYQANSVASPSTSMKSPSCQRPFKTTSAIFGHQQAAVTALGLRTCVLEDLVEVCFAASMCPFSLGSMALGFMMQQETGRDLL